MQSLTLLSALSRFGPNFALSDQTNKCELNCKVFVQKEGDVMGRKKVVMNGRKVIMG